MARIDDPGVRIARFRALGMPDSVIMNRLALEGWSEEVLHQALDVPAPPAALPVHAAEQPFREAPAALTGPSISVTRTKKTFSRHFTFALAVAATAAFAAAVYMYLQPPVVYSISIPQSATSGPELTYGALPALSDPAYYKDVVANLMAQKASFIDANLSSMKLSVYVNGVAELQIPILAKGKVGSWWETPAGIYKIQSKETNHFSTFGEVYMPYSMDFQGNFFIHGWPYYADGTPVSTTFSGGCIRLATDDAQKVYELAGVGMPIVVYNEEAATDAFGYQLKAPSISATNYLVADLGNNAVLTGYGASSTVPIASITKLITALVATEYINLDRSITVPRDAVVYTAISRLHAGQTIRAYDLLFLLLQESSNEAAETLARAVGRELFVEHMNEKARAIGMNHTLFSDPSGAKNDLSTAEDLFALLRYIYSNRRFVFSITTGNLTDSAYGAPAFKNISNFNRIKNAPAELLGGKIGETNQSGETYAGIFSVDIGGQNRNLAVVVLGSRDASGDVLKLLNFVHAQYAPAATVSEQ
ncbi:L,D-transpeptidase family protein [Candidatus Kaiserbacteria bacterium]|nr:L,D-transpeptidase family protein [Candidatus Kaiserbacteria bacterium]